MALSTALTLLLIGMITVFVVLLLVVLVGNLLIFFVNRYLSPQDQDPDSTGISAKEVAVLTATVEVITQGKGVIERIEKLR
ncbi:MAG: oxaloacetate decarboxylase [Bacteroidota bacterium]